jgi:hypothetical protein
MRRDGETQNEYNRRLARRYMQGVLGTPVKECGQGGFDHEEWDEYRLGQKAASEAREKARRKAS